MENAKQKKQGAEKKMKKIIVVGLLICVMLVATISPIGNYPVGISEIKQHPVWVSEIGVSKIAVSGLGTPNLTDNNISEDTEKIEPENTRNNESKNTEKAEDSEIEDTKEIELEEPMGIEELLANVFNCSESVIFAADSSYGLLSKEFFMEFLETNDKNEEPRISEIHDCDDFSMEFLMEIKAACAIYGFVPAVGVVWVKDCDAEDDDSGHAINFWINPKDKSVWAFDPQTDEEYSLENQIVTFVYI